MLLLFFRAKQRILQMRKLSSRWLVITLSLLFSLSLSPSFYLFLLFSLSIPLSLTHFISFSYSHCLSLYVIISLSFNISFYIYINISLILLSLCFFLCR
jgi:hypothetical protein